MGNRKTFSPCISALFNVMSVYHLKLPYITLASLVLLFENPRPKERKGILMRFFSPTYFSERKGREGRKGKVSEEKGWILRGEREEGRGKRGEGGGGRGQRGGGRGERRGGKEKRKTELVFSSRSPYLTALQYTVK